MDSRLDVSCRRPYKPVGYPVISTSVVLKQRCRSRLRWTHGFECYLRIRYRRWHADTLENQEDNLPVLLPAWSSWYALLVRVRRARYAENKRRALGLYIVLGASPHSNFRISRTTCWSGARPSPDVSVSGTTQLPSNASSRLLPLTHLLIVPVLMILHTTIVRSPREKQKYMISATSPYRNKRTLL